MFVLKKFEEFEIDNKNDEEILPKRKLIMK